MKKLVFIAFVPVLFACTSAVAQSPAPEPDTISHPIKEGDPALRALPPRLDYVEDKRRITPEEVPLPVREALEGSATYRDWKEATIYHDENKDEYIVEFKQADKTVSHRFNKEGAPIIEE